MENRITNNNNKSRLGLLFELFFVFFKIGAFTFGGGYAMISVIEREAVEKHKWLTSEDIVNMVIIAESTPGVIAVNSATFAGYKHAGVLGGIVATLGAVMPAFIIISIISYFFDVFKDNYWINAIFMGINCCVPVLIFKAFMKLSRSLKPTWYNISALAAVIVIMTLTPVSSIYLIIAGGVVGVAAAFAFKPKPLNGKVN